MMTLILLLIVAVAAFNIVASLYMVVSDKRRDIAILRTLGLEPGAVARVFLTQGAVIGWLGALAGVGLGLLLATHIDTVVPFIENVLAASMSPGMAASLDWSRGVQSRALTH